MSWLFFGYLRHMPLSSSMRLRLFNHFLQGTLHDFVVTEIVAELIVSGLVHQHIRRNTVNLELFAEILPLFVVQAEMFPLDVRNRLFVSDEG